MNPTILSPDCSGMDLVMVALCHLSSACSMGGSLPCAPTQIFRISQREPFGSRFSTRCCPFGIWNQRPRQKYVVLQDDKFQIIFHFNCEYGKIFINVEWGVKNIRRETAQRKQRHTREYFLYTRESNVAEITLGGSGFP